MNNVLEAIIFYDDLSEEQQKALFAAIDGNPKLAGSFKKWRALQYEVRSSLSSSIPNRDLLVLYALSQENPELLTSSEQAILTEAGPGLEAAFTRHPALADVVKDIHSAHDDFLSLWEDLATSSNLEDTTPKAPILKEGASDRAPAKPNRRRATMYRIAAVFLLLAITTTTGILTWRSQNLEIVKTSAGEFRVIELVDGSTIRLFGKSKISYSKHSDQFSKNRSIELKGRAFFDIAPNPSPFVVQTATALTEATGTKFSVEADRSLTKIILTAGQVAVASRQRTRENILLSPGEMSTVRRRKQPSPPEAMEDLTDLLSWTGLLVFHDTPLDEVAAHLSDHYDVSVSIASDLEGEQWVATYDPDTLSVNQILDNLATTLGAVVETTSEDTYLLSR